MSPRRPAFDARLLPPATRSAVAAVRRRVGARRALAAALWGLGVAALGCAAAWWGVRTGWLPATVLSVAGWAAVVASAAPAIVAWGRRPSWLEGARRLDVGCALEGRLGAAVALAPRASRSPFARLALEDAERVAARADARRAAPWRWPVRPAIAAAVGAGLWAMSAVLPTPGAPAVAGRVVGALDGLAAPQRRVASARVERARRAELAQRAEEAARALVASQDPTAQAAAVELRALARKLRAREVTLSAAWARVEAVRAQVERWARRDAEARRAVRRALARAARSLRSRPLRAARKALRRGDLEAAARALDAAAAGSTRGARRAAQRDVRRMARRLERAAERAESRRAADALRRMARGLRESTDARGGGAAGRPASSGGEAPSRGASPGEALRREARAAQRTASAARAARDALGRAARAVREAVRRSAARLQGGRTRAGHSGRRGALTTAGRRAGGGPPGTRHDPSTLRGAAAPRLVGGRRDESLQTSAGGAVREVRASRADEAAQRARPLRGGPWEEPEPGSDEEASEKLPVGYRAVVRRYFEALGAGGRGR